MARYRRELWVHEMQDERGDFVPIGMGKCDDRSRMFDGVAAAYRVKKAARAAGRIPRWAKTRHRLVRYIPAPEKASK
jgi:hypothetical protein